MHNAGSWWRAAMAAAMVRRQWLTQARKAGGAPLTIQTLPLVEIGGDHGQFDRFFSMPSVKCVELPLLEGLHARDS